MNYLVVTTKSWNIENYNILKAEDQSNNWNLILDKDDLVYEKIKAINPRYIFFPHWSWIIPKDIYENFECIVFHMTDLPYGRGGSPLQNLIVRGHKKTKLSVIKVVKDLDAGPVYFKMDLDLSGTATDILTRASKLTFSAIRKLVDGEFEPQVQVGEVIKFERRKPQDGDISLLGSTDRIYDYIRMLDGEGYPRAFLEKGNLRFEFEEAKIVDGSVEAKVKIRIISN